MAKDSFASHRLNLQKREKTIRALRAVNAEIKIHESAEKVIAYSLDKRSFMR
jgi:hypothetical protein